MVPEESPRENKVRGEAPSEESLELGGAEAGGGPAQSGGRTFPRSVASRARCYRDFKGTRVWAPEGHCDLVGDILE